MAVNNLSMTPNTEVIGGGWEEARGNWVIDENGYLVVEGAQPASPRWELSQVMGTTYTIQTKLLLSIPYSQDANLGLKLRISDAGTFLWLRMSNEDNRIWIDYYNGSSYSQLFNRVPVGVSSTGEYVLTVSDDGNIIKCWLDDTPVFSEVIEENTGETRHGLMVANAGYVKVESLLWADYAATSSASLLAPRITLNGLAEQTVYLGDSFVDAGATAFDPNDNSLAVTVTGSVDDTTEGLYTLTYSATYEGSTVTVQRVVNVRPENYLPVIQEIEDLTVVSGAAVTLQAVATDQDGDTLTYAWSQVDNGTQTLTVGDANTATCYFTMPEVTENTQFEFQLSVSDGVNNPVLKTVFVNVAAAVPVQRTSANRTGVAIFESVVSLTIPNETGFVSHDVSLINKETGESIVNGVYEFENGNLEIPAATPRGLPYVGVISEGVVFPADNAQPVMGASTGDIVCRSNEMLNNRTGLFPSNLTSVGDLNDTDGTFYTERGGLVTKIGDNSMYSPNGMFDHLNHGEEDVDYIKYYVGESEFNIPIRILPSLQTGSNIAGSDALITNYAFEEGKTYEIAFTVAGMTTGEITPLFNVPSINDNDYSLSKNARDVWHMKAPAGATSLTLTGSNGFDGTISNLHIREVFKPTQAVAPRKLEIRSIRKSQPFLQAVMHPLYSIIENQPTIDNDYTGEPRFNSEFGVRHTSLAGNVRIKDASFDGFKGAVSLRGGEHLNCDNVDTYSGYPTELSRWQTGFSPSETNGGQFKSIVFNNCHTNMGLEPHGGDYSNGSNSDCIVLNSDNRVDLGYEHTAYSGNCYMYDPADGVIDAKMLSITNYFRGENGWRVMRGHSKSIHLLCNTSMFTGDATQCAIHVAYTRSRAILFNTYVNGNRIVDRDDLLVDQVVSQDTPRDVALNTIHIAKAMPNVTDNILYAFDELHGQYKETSSSTWIDLPPIYHNHAEALGWHLSVDDGNYDFRVKSVLGTSESGWTYLNNKEVLNVTN